MTNITFLFPVLVQWVTNIVYSILAFFDGIVYSLVSYSFEIFSLMCQINFNRIYTILSPLFDRLESVVIVLIMVKLAMELITYLINPDSFQKGGPKLLVNIAIAGAMLILYSTFFSLMNEINMLVVGYSSGSESFPILGQIAGVTGDEDSGLIMRFVFGQDNSVSSVGESIAFQTLGVFVSDKGSDGTSHEVLKEVLTNDEGDGYNFMQLGKIADKVDVSVEYKPVLPFIFGLLLVYLVFKSAIQIGIRALKLIILQLIAPIAIITVFKDGTKSKTFSTFKDEYISTYISAFILELGVLIPTVLAGSLLGNISSFFGDVTSVSEAGFTRLLLILIMILAMYLGASKIAEMINKILKTNLATDKNPIGSILGGALGFAGGLGAGIVGGAGIAGTMGTAFSGLAKGAAGGGKGKTIADMFKNQSEINKGSRDLATKIARTGGGLAYAGHAIENKLGVTDREQLELQRRKDAGKALDNMMAARGAALKNAKAKYTSQDGKISFDYGDNADSFASRYADADSGVQAAEADYHSAYENGPRKTIDENGNVIKTEEPADYAQRLAGLKNAALSARENAESEGKRKWNIAAMDVENNPSIDKESKAAVSETTRLYSRKSDKGYTINELKKGHKRTKDDKGDEYTGEEIDYKKASNHYKDRTSHTENKGANRREARPGRY